MIRYINYATHKSGYLKLLLVGYLYFTVSHKLFGKFFLALVSVSQLDIWEKRNPGKRAIELREWSLVKFKDNCYRVLRVMWRRGSKKNIYDASIYEHKNVKYSRRKSKLAKSWHFHLHISTTAVLFAPINPQRILFLKYQTSAEFYFLSEG